MDSNASRRDRMRAQIAHTQQFNSKRIDREQSAASSPSIASDISKAREFAATFAHLPPFPPRLPRPDYATSQEQLLLGTNSPEQDADQLDFFLACETGDLPFVEGYVQRTTPSQAVRQYALEQASFHNQPAVARYLLLQAGTVLHNNAFDRCESSPDQAAPEAPPTETLCDVFAKHPNPAEDERHDLAPLMQTFLEAGWHPNQVWSAPASSKPQVPLLKSACVLNKPLTRLLLANGADPAVGLPSQIGADLNSLPDEEYPLDRSGDTPFQIAISTYDPSYLQELATPGPNPRRRWVLFKLVEKFGSIPVRVASEAGASPPTPFDKRRATAEYLLGLESVDINFVRDFPSFTFRGNTPVMATEQQTVLSEACRASDWGYVEWLLEKGADPHLLNDKALRPQSFMPTVQPNNDPAMVRRLIALVKSRKEKEESGNQNENEEDNDDDELVAGET